MSDSIWDQYGNWDDIAKGLSVEAIKKKITGNDSWAPNHTPEPLATLLELIVSLHKEYGSKATVLDFGCGLGRNAPTLRKLFPRVVGFDTESMITRFRAIDPEAVVKSYDAIYADLDRLVGNENIHFLYDSVVFQHLVSAQHMTETLSKLMRMPAFTTIITIKNGGIQKTLAELYVQERGWRSIFSGQDTVSFPGAIHTVSVFRRTC
jgi:2-polyprenyl-3-methyl-5-hydroxy-6-metoxy-1,4-benzoquinol methylase